MAREGDLNALQVTQDHGSYLQADAPIAERC